MFKYESHAHTWNFQCQIDGGEPSDPDQKYTHCMCVVISIFVV